MELPASLFLYVLLLVALAIGFLLGRREKEPTKPQTTVIKDYYQGLNFLLGERPELGVDRFIEAMEVNDDSADVHLALASVLRRRGEVDKAIRLHQNLLASPRLSKANKQIVEMELARDYHSAGLLDRAEGLLTSIIEARGSEHDAAVALLMDLYEQEREWQQAIGVSQRLKVSDETMNSRLSHIHCEAAVEHLKNREMRLAKDAVKAAISADGLNPRGYWLAAEIDQLSRKYKSSIRRLNKVVELRHDLAAEIMDLYAQACDALGLQSDYLDFIMQNLDRFPDPRLLLALIEYRRQHALDVGLHDIVTYIEKAPSDMHFGLLLELLDESDSAAQQRVRKLLQKVSSSARHHQCANCGFTTGSHLWHCPTCKHWGSFARSVG